MSTSTWPCRICTFNNGSDASQCAMCSTARLTDPEWQCAACMTRNSSSCTQCTNCYRVKPAIFSQKHIADLNQWSATHLNQALSPSRSAPMSPTRDMNQHSLTDIHMHKPHHIHSHSTDNKCDNRSSSLFDIYTKNKKKTLNPIDIKLSRKPSLGAHALRIRYDEDFNLSTSPSPPSDKRDSLSSCEAHDSVLVSNIFHKKHTHKLQKNKNLDIMNKMVRKYSDPSDQTTTTLLITKELNESEYSMDEIKESMHQIDEQIAQILHKRHNNEYYRYVTQKTIRNDIIHCAELVNKNDIMNIKRNRMILLCGGCETEMVCDKCTDSRSQIQCYGCDIYINKLAMEYWHCPNVQISEHEHIGRDLCGVCGIKMILKQDKQRQETTDIEERETHTMGGDEHDILLYENYVQYQTAKIEEMIPSILKITSLDDFEYIYQGINHQTLEFGHRSHKDEDILNILQSQSRMLAQHLTKIEDNVTKSKSNKNDIQNESAAISNDITKVSSEINALMKKMNVLSKKKLHLQSQMQSIQNVLSTMNQHEHNLSTISSKTHIEKEKVEQRIQHITSYNDKVDQLHNILNKKRNRLFGKWQIWNTKQVLLQLKHYLKTNNITLNSLQNITQQFHIKGIKGCDLPNLNELTFKMMNINHAFDQKMLILWIQSITATATLRTPTINNVENENRNDGECKMELEIPDSPSITTPKQLHICAVCMVNAVDVILQPCGHICICHQCSVKIKQICPVCRKKITEIANCFFASR